MLFQCWRIVYDVCLLWFISLVSFQSSLVALSVCLSVCLDCTLLSPSIRLVCVIQLILRWAKIHCISLSTTDLTVLTLILLDFIFQPLEVVSRYRDPQPQVVENYSYLLNLRPNIYKMWCLDSDFILNNMLINRFNRLIKLIRNNYCRDQQVKGYCMKQKTPDNNQMISMLYAMLHPPPPLPPPMKFHLRT